MRISDWSSDVCSSDLRLEISRAARSLISSLSVSDCAYFQSATILSRWIFLRFNPRAIVTITDSNSPTGPARCQLTGSHLKMQIGRAHVWTPVTNAHIVCRLLLETTTQNYHSHQTSR